MRDSRLIWSNLPLGRMRFILKRLSLPRPDMLTHTVSGSSFTFEQRYWTSVCDAELAEVVWLPMLSLPSEVTIQCEFWGEDCDILLYSGGSDCFLETFPI